MNTLTLAEFAEQHRHDLLVEATEYREAVQARRGRFGRRRARTARSKARHGLTGRRPQAATR
ncbi:MAG TPA: hypothetical protein VF053_17305 [Streptosporangiales bacterium]